MDSTILLIVTGSGFIFFALAAWKIAWLMKKVNSAASSDEEQDS